MTRWDSAHTTSGRRCRGMRRHRRMGQGPRSPASTSSQSSSRSPLSFTNRRRSVDYCRGRMPARASWCRSMWMRWPRRCARSRRRLTYVSSGRGIPSLGTWSYPRKGCAACGSICMPSYDPAHARTLAPVTLPPCLATPLNGGCGGRPTSRAAGRGVAAGHGSLLDAFPACPGDRPLTCSVSDLGYLRS